DDDDDEPRPPPRPPGSAAVTRRTAATRAAGGSLRSVRRVPPDGVGSSSKIHCVPCPPVRLAKRRSGWKSTTRLVVGQKTGPCRLMLNERVPSAVGPVVAKTLRAWLLHRGALRTSETISHTRAGGASISIDRPRGVPGSEAVVWSVDIGPSIGGLGHGVSMVGQRRPGRRSFAVREHRPASFALDGGEC